MTPALQGWLDGGEPTLGDDERLVAMAAILDEYDVVSVQQCFMDNFFATSDEQSRDALTECLAMTDEE